MRILLGINVLTSVDSQVYGNHFAFAYHLGTLKEKGIEVILFTPWRMSIDRMRNMAAKYALETECDYLMFVDDDVCVQPDTLERLIAADKDIVMALTYIRGNPFNPMAFKKSKEYEDGSFDLEFCREVDTREGLVDVDAVGFACVLIKVSLLKKVSKPYFVTTPYNTEDVHFCVKCKQEYPETTIAVDTSCPTYHLLDKEMVGKATVEKLRKFYEETTAESVRQDRGTEYYNQLMR